MLRPAPACLLAVALMVFPVTASPARADGSLWAAAGKVDLSPDLRGRPVWLAGFGTGRRAESVNDPLCARALVLHDGRTTLALVALDLVGIFHPDVERIRERIAARAAVDLVVVAATHTHHGPDTMGLWGPLPMVSGVDERYLARVREETADLVVRLCGDLQPARIAFAETRAPVDGFVRDSRDPVVFDDTLSALVVEGSDGAGAIGTVVNWACHPETLWSRNPHVTADYCGYACRRMEEALGGTAVFFSGALGGLLTPDPVRNAQGDVQHTFAEAERIGRGIADRALAALASAPRLRAAPLRFAQRRLFVRVDNPRYHLAMRVGAIRRSAVDAQGRPFRGLPTRTNVGHVATEVCAFSVGPSVWVTVPGELFPELAVGGYDGSRSAGKPVVAPGNPNPPALERAPGPPYLRERMAAPFTFLIGLGNDELGYLVPEYDFKVNDKSPLWEPEPPGDHYEETNSVGAGAAGTIVGALADLLESLQAPPTAPAGEDRR